MEAPRRCPCCNSDAFVFQSNGLAVCRCGTCGLTTKEHADSAAARRAWNRRFDGRYGITANELADSLVTTMRNWCEHWSVPSSGSLERPAEFPLEQVLSSVLYQALMKGSANRSP